MGRGWGDETDMSSTNTINGCGAFNQQAFKDLFQITFFTFMTIVMLTFTVNRKLLF